MPGFMNTTTSLTVYKIDDVNAVTFDKLKQFAFQSIDDLVLEPNSWGWASIDDMFDTTWSFSVPEKGQFICFALRVDTRKVSSAVLKKHLAAAFKEEEEKNRAEGQAFRISRACRKELKEAHTSKLLSRAEPVPRSVDVAVDTSTGLVYVGTTSGSLLELFEQHFVKSFGGTVKQLCRGLEDQDDLEEGAVEQFMQRVYEGLNCTASFDGHVYTITEAGQMTLIQDAESELQVKNVPDSAKAGLDAGLTVKKIKIRIAREGEEDLVWSLTLNPDFSFSGLKTPKMEKPQGDDDPDAAMLEKLYLINQAVGVMHTLFRQVYV